jgi:hypothetical protein
MFQISREAQRMIGAYEKEIITTWEQVTFFLL